MGKGAIVALACLTGAASAQSINVDFGSEAGVPSDAFAGVGEAGRWNNGTGPEAANLRGLDGAETGVSLEVVLGTSTSGFPDPSTAGDVSALLDDVLLGSGDVVQTVYFEGLEPGIYDVWTYDTVTTSDTRTLVYVDSYYQTIGGEFGGRFEEGVTHGQFTTRVDSDGELEIGFVADLWDSSGVMNGVQLVYEPCLADANRDDTVDFHDVRLYLDRYSAGDQRADTNYDLIIDFNDVLEFLDLYQQGCV